MNAATTIRSLLRFWYLPVLGALAAISATLILTASEPPVYEATSTYIVSPAIGDTFDAAESIRTLDDPRSRAVVSTYLEVLSSSAVTREAASVLGIDESVTVDYEVRAVLLPEANVVELAVTGPVPEITVALSDAIGARAGDTFESLYQIYDVGLLDRAEIPTQPAGRGFVETAGLAAALGFLLGGATAVLVGLPAARRRESMRNRLGRYGGSGTATVTALPAAGDERYSRTG